MPIGSDRIEMPQLKNYDHSSDNVYGGVQAYFKGENATLTQNAPKLEEVALTLNALTALAYASHKMMTFSPIAVGSYLLPKMAEAITWKEEDKFLNGSGVGMPLGVVGHAGTVSITIETGQTLADNAVLTENVVKMRQALRVARPGSVVWLYNQTDLLFWLSLLTVSVGTGGSTFGLIQQITNDINFRMLGIPLIDTEHCKAAGTVGDIVLGDWSEYIVADNRRGPEVAQSMHLQFDTGQSAFRIITYVDGQPRYSAKFTRQNSTNQCAPFVTLAARS
jgi:HK97 family phage major capsid protein